MLEHSKAALVIAVSALERRTRVSDREGVFQRAKAALSPPLPVPALSASAGLAVIANVNKTWPQFVFKCTFKYLNRLWHLIYHRHLNWPSGMETNQAPLVLFKYLKRIDSVTRVELHIDVETCEFPTLLKMCLSPVLARPGVSVCD